MTHRMDENETTPVRSERARILQALILAGSMAAMVLAVSYLRAHGLIEAAPAERLRGVIIGLFLIVTGNSIPKNRSRHADKNCAPTRNQTFARFAGWTFVLCGLGYTISWLAVPIEHAETVAIVFIIASIVLVLPRMAWCVLKRGPSQTVGS